MSPSKMRAAAKEVTGEVFSNDPAELFSALAERGHTFFLDSGGGRSNLVGYSILGCEPDFVLRCRGRADALDELERALGEWSVDYRGPLPFVCGAVGYLSYDLGRFTEGVRMRAADDLKMPDLEFGFYDRAVVCDNLSKRVWLTACGRTESDCEKKIVELRSALKRKIEPAEKEFDRKPAFASNFSRARYMRAVGRVREYIRAGDVYQVNLSQMFSAKFKADSWGLYRRLREVNPAPFAAYLNFGENRVLSSSPERFLKVDGGVIETRPIKGTRPRGKNPIEDARLARELLASGKDRAEHVMIVDLERNDLGKICEYGSVRVREFEVLESYPTVHHMVSTVEGKLKRGASPVDCVRACFPGGSITGAPKVRSMEIIDELEPTRRGLYTGSIGYFGFDGRMDLNIAIRTMVQKRGRIFFSVGGGVVADSNPEAEYDETIDKARALFQSLGVMV